MINELYQLSRAMVQAGVQAPRWHIHYKPIPNVTTKAPCIRITISEGRVAALSTVPIELGACLRKYGKGTNAGSYPCMNLAPLYRITDDTIKKSLSALKAEDLNADRIEQIKSWCKDSNWGKKFRSLYKKSMENQSAELLALVPSYEPLQILVEESSYFFDPMILHQELENIAFRMLERKDNFALALQVLFYLGKEEEADKYGSISVAFESQQLVDLGVPAVSNRFVSELNSELNRASQTVLTSENGEQLSDAFGVPFVPAEKSIPMPTVKLAGGFDATLRTMFSGQPCQTRYGRIEDASYPISPEMRENLHASLDWLGGRKEHENVTWMNIGKGEILLVYPSRITEGNISYTRMFGHPKKNDAAFQEQARQFLSQLRHGREIGADTKADWIQLFILKKIDKARVKVAFSRQTDAHELEKCSEAWTSGCSNLPHFYFGIPKVPFPLEAANVLNCFWKQNGERTTDKCRAVPQYHGLELLMAPDLSVTADLHVLSEKSRTIGAFLGNLLVKKDLHHPIWEQIAQMLALIGLMLHRKGIGKEHYMEDFPYQYGQLLKVSDELHAMYCRTMRDGNLPPQLAGSSVYQAAAEAPLRTLGLLGQRMSPYIAWAKTYRTNTDSEDGTGAGLAKWLLRMYEEIVGKLNAVWTADMRFSDEERAQLFIGYLASFPKREQNKRKDMEAANQTEEVQKL